MLALPLSLVLLVAPDAGIDPCAALEDRTVALDAASDAFRVAREKLLACRAEAGNAAERGASKLPPSKLVDPKWEGTTTALKQKNGFRDVTLGMERSKVAGTLVEVAKESGGRVRTCVRTEDSKRLGDAALDSIAYGFFRGRLYAISLATKGEENSRAMLRAFEASYGAGERTNEYAEDRAWAAGDVAAKYVENAITHEAHLTIISMKLVEEAQRADAEAAKGADL